MSSTQTIRFRRPTDKKPEEPKKRPLRHTGILQDQTRRSSKAPWTPSFSLGVRILFFIRFFGAMYSNIDDCDEVFNFWEPLHFFQYGNGFQTWETSPESSIRSWAYILLHLPLAKLGSFISTDKVSKRASFFAVRIFLALISTLSEVFLYRNVFSSINERVGRYLFVILLSSTGMWNASSAFLPSSFATYTTTIAFAASVAPASIQQGRKVLISTLMFATGAIVGWPFALALALPFVYEQLFIYGGDRVPSNVYKQWIITRWATLVRAGLLASLIFIPVIGIDSIAYGKPTVVPWNIVAYNIFSDHGPNLYGTEPSNFYILNLLLNFNVVLPLALISIPALVVTYMIDYKRLGLVKKSPEESSPFTVLALKLSPFYLWLFILSAQDHKEERFMFPAYTLLCFNAAVTLYLMRGWIEAIFVKLTKSPYRASQTSIFKNFTFSVVIFSMLISFSRILANWNYYHAPMRVFFEFESIELPRLLNASNLLPIPLLPPDYVMSRRESKEQQKIVIDMSRAKELELTICIGKEWYRFPSSYLVPEGVRVDFIKSEFDGMLPGHFGEGGNRVGLADPRIVQYSKWWPRPETRFIPNGLNDMNKEDSSHYVPVETCDYLVDLDFPAHPVSSLLEPRYAIDSETWDRVLCFPFLDARHSPLLSRTLWLPGTQWRDFNSWGDYCLLRNRKLVSSKVDQAKKRKGA